MPDSPTPARLGPDTPPELSPGMVESGRIEIGRVRDVEILDTPAVRVHHPSDLVGVVVSAIGAVLVLVLATYAQNTTTGVAEDVQGFASILRQILNVPVAVLEGAVTILVPLCSRLLRAMVLIPRPRATLCAHLLSEYRVSLHPLTDTLRVRPLARIQALTNLRVTTLVALHGVVAIAAPALKRHRLTVLVTFIGREELCRLRLRLTAGRATLCSAPTRLVGPRLASLPADVIPLRILALRTRAEHARLVPRVLA